MAKFLFWISAGFAIYIYLGYPLLLWGFRAALRSTPKAQPLEPSVSLLVAAYNEAKVIGDKLRNSLAIDYPPDKLEIVVASDGSRDATAQIVRTFAESQTRGRIRLIHFEKNRGKMAVLNDAVPAIARGHCCFLRRI